MTNTEAAQAMRTGKQDTQMTSDPVCPHCGHIHRDAWEWNFGPGLEGERLGYCDSCGGEFMTEREVSVYYTTTATPQPTQPEAAHSRREA